MLHLCSFNHARSDPFGLTNKYLVFRFEYRTKSSSARAPSLKSSTAPSLKSSAAPVFPSGASKSSSKKSSSMKSSSMKSSNKKSSSVGSDDGRDQDRTRN